MAGQIDRSGRVDDISVVVDADFLLHAADSAKLRYMPQLAKRLAMRFGRRLHFDFLEAVFAAMLTRMALRDSFSAIL